MMSASPPGSIPPTNIRAAEQNERHESGRVDALNLGPSLNSSIDNFNRKPASVLIDVRSLRGFIK